MARLLTQLFEVTDLFQMKMRPELLLLQKTMVVVEGVARSLDPKLNIWVAAEPIVREWVTAQLGPGAQLREAVSNVSALAAALKQAPELIERGSRLVEAIGGARDALESAAPGGRRTRLVTSVPIWIGAIALIAIAFKLLLG